MRELRHDNLVPFLGACVESGHICILMPFCSRGSLEDVLDNEDYRLDNMFIASLVADLIKVSFLCAVKMRNASIISEETCVTEFTIVLANGFASFWQNISA